MAIASLIAVGLAGTGSAGEFRIGAHAAYLNPKASEFDGQIGFGGSLKYKFNDFLGIEIGTDYFQWSIDELVDMPYSLPDSTVYYNEKDKVMPLYFQCLVYSGPLEKYARAYLGVGGGYYYIDADIEGSYNVVDPGSGAVYPVSVTGDVTGQYSLHVSGGVDFMLSQYIYLNVEARYVFTRIDREQTHSNPDLGTITVKEDDTDFWNWQVRAGLEYRF